jgi:hypothetical protein
MHSIRKCGAQNILDLEFELFHLKHKALVAKYRFLQKKVICMWVLM